MGETQQIDFKGKGGSPSGCHGTHGLCPKNALPMAETCPCPLSASALPPSHSRQLSSQPAHLTSNHCRQTGAIEQSKCKAMPLISANVIYYASASEPNRPEIFAQQFKQGPNAQSAFEVCERAASPFPSLPSLPLAPVGRDGAEHRRPRRGRGAVVPSRRVRCLRMYAWRGARPSQAPHPQRSIVRNRSLARGQSSGYINGK